jgi:isoleucyl-tRNA synthetase
LRADKKVGSSLEVAVYIKCNDSKILEDNKDELANIFITSQAYVTSEKPNDVLTEYTEDDYTIWVTKAKGEKCERCWKYRELGNHSGHETICDECFEAIQ